MHEIDGRDNPSKRSRAQELDDFWDIESLLPSKAKRPFFDTSSIQGSRVEAVEVELDAPKARVSDEKPICDVPIKAEHKPTRPSIPASSAPPVVYSPKHPLIREVRVYPWRSDFRFYERFCTTAKRMFSLRGKESEAVPFFSYMPQYDQMNRAQLAWYLYWRENVRAGIYLPTDYSYIFLYLFEVINLPDEIPPHEGQRILCEVWRQYRSTYPLLNRYLADWICDYSLIHQLPPPGDTLSGELRLIAERSSFREFYACPTGDDASHDADVYMLFCSNYDYRKSKVYLGDGARAEMMDAHIPAALSAVLHVMEEEGKAFAASKMQKASFSRDSFVGALCSAQMKRRIEVDYCSFTRSHELRFLITDILKYSENKLRAHFGVKSKLTIYALPDHIKTVLDAYFAEVLPSRRGGNHIREQRPAYESLYDLPHTELSFEHAANIEQASWSMTERLVEAFEDLPKEVDIIPSKAVRTSEIERPKEPSKEGLLAYRAFILAALEGDLGSQRNIARESGMLPDALAERINTVASDTFGDIVIEQNERGGYAVIEDYVEDIRSMLKIQG